MIGIRTAIAGSLGGGKSWDADLVTYITGLETPLSSGQLTLLNNFILALKSGLSITNLLDAFDCMYILAGETAESSLRNLVKRSHDATAVNSPTFTALEGFRGDGISSYIDTNYNPYSQKVNSNLDDCAYGVYIRTNTTSYGSTKYYLTSLNIANQRIIALSYNSQNYRINSTNYTTAAFVTPNFIGASRNEAASFNVFDATYYNNAEGASTTVPNANIHLIYNTDSQQSFYFQGKSISESQKNIIVNAFEAYMDANGKGVI